MTEGIASIPDTTRAGPTVSVVIATYNYAKYLRECLKSVFEQTFSDYEIIVVDDGSTDETPHVLESITDPKLKKLRIQNQCISAARNVGLDQASGEFVAFLDADDRWLPRKLERQVLLLRSEALVGLVFSDFVRFNETEYLPNAFSFFPEIRSFPSRPSADGGGRVVVGDAFEVLLRFQFFPTFAQVTMFRRSLLGDLRFPTQLRMSEDLYFLMRLYERTEVAIIDDPLAEVRRHGKNISHSHLEQRLWDLKALRILEADAAPEHRKEVRARLAVAHAGTGYHFFWRRQPLKAARHYFSAMAYPGKRFNALVHLAALPISVFLPPRQTIE